MRSKKTNGGASGSTATTVVVMCLYVAGGAPNSAQAITNLEAICEEHFKDRYKLEVVDVLEFPQRGLADGILVTPSLTRLSPSPFTTIVGNLSDTSGVLRALGI